MNDILERLRGYDPHPSTLELEAADEIERLRAENKEHLQLKKELVLKAYPAMDERDQLLEMLDARISMHHEAEDEANKAKSDCEHWAKNYAELQQKMADLRVVANYNREQAEKAEAERDLAQQGVLDLMTERDDLKDEIERLRKINTKLQRDLSDRINDIFEHDAEVEKWQSAFAAQSRKLQAVLDIPGVRATLKEVYEEPNLCTHTAQNEGCSNPVEQTRGDGLPQPRRKDGEEPCGECHIQPGETCDICGAVQKRKKT